MYSNLLEDEAILLRCPLSLFDVRSEMIDIRSRGQEVGSNVLQWLRCDDENITAVTTDEVRNTEGYILFYVAK